jgi:hypothetical protein
VWASLVVWVCQGHSRFNTGLTSAAVLAIVQCAHQAYARFVITSWYQWFPTGGVWGEEASL